MKKHKILKRSSRFGTVKGEELLELERPIIDACIKSAKRCGWSDAAGLLRGFLFLEGEPMSLDMLAEKTGYSKTTIRSTIKSLENLGLVKRVVDPLRQDHSKQHLYALERDPERMRQVIQSTIRDEIHSISEALNQVEKNLEDLDEHHETRAIISSNKYFYEMMDKIMELMDQVTLEELIDILENNKKSDATC
jgi:DNA-binding transcriptional regulator GbsR (MarR family)